MRETLMEKVYKNVEITYNGFEQKKKKPIMAFNFLNLAKFILHRFFPLFNR